MFCVSCTCSPKAKHSSECWSPFSNNLQSKQHRKLRPIIGSNHKSEAWKTYYQRNNAWQHVVFNISTSFRSDSSPYYQLSLTYSLIHTLLLPVFTLYSVKVHYQKERKCVPCVSLSREVGYCCCCCRCLVGIKPGTTSHRVQPISPAHTDTHWTLKGGDKAEGTSM